MVSARFQVQTDARAQAWLEAHPPARDRLIAYSAHRCCGGGQICQVTIRELALGEDATPYERGMMEDGAPIFIDRRAARRLPARFGLTVRGLGPLKHLDLELDGEQWGDLLYT